MNELNTKTSPVSMLNTHLYYVCLSISDNETRLEPHVRQRNTFNGTEIKICILLLEVEVSSSVSVHWFCSLW